jgi:hypothetical protein
VKVDADTDGAIRTVDDLPNKITPLQLPVGVDVDSAKREIEGLPQKVGALKLATSLDEAGAKRELAGLPNKAGRAEARHERSTRPGPSVRWPGLPHKVGALKPRHEPRRERRQARDPGAGQQESARCGSTRHSTTPS